MFRLFAADMPIVPPSPDRSRPGSPNGLDDSMRMDTGHGGHGHGGRGGFGRNGAAQDSEEVSWFYLLVM